MTTILNELNEDNGKNYKVDVLKKHKGDKVLTRLLAMTYDKVRFTYGITMKNIRYTPEATHKRNALTLTDALDFLELEICTRNLTGNAAQYALESVLEGLTADDAVIIGKVLGRDLKVGLGRTYINKVHKGLVIKPPYMRCGIYSAKTAKKITFPAYVQEKCDGRYVAVIVESGAITFQSRSGEEQEFPALHKKFRDIAPGVYIGELLVEGESNRALANGMINSSNPPHDRIVLQLWDFIPLEEWSRPKDTEDKTEYSERFRELKRNIAGKKLLLVATQAVQNIKEALEFTQDVMAEGGEGAILKDRNNIFKDHTSPTQLKLKVAFEIDVYITGFTHGTKGTSREKTFGAIVYTTEATGKDAIRGQVSGLTDAQLLDFNGRREELIGTVMAIQANDITKARDKPWHALSHPRFIELRPDKKKADTFKRCVELLESAKELG